MNRLVAHTLCRSLELALAVGVLALALQLNAWMT